MVDVLRKWEAHGMKMAKLGVAVDFRFTLRKRIILAETLDRLSNFEVDQEFQQVPDINLRNYQPLSLLCTQATHDILEGLAKVDEKEAVKLAALQYCLQPLTAKLLTEMCIPASEIFVHWALI
jgi:hypothetical protein